MTIAKILDVSSDNDKEALIFFLGKNDKWKCPYCKFDEYYLMGSWRIRCKNCKKDNWPFKNTYFSKMRISPFQWFMLIEVFSEELAFKDKKIPGLAIGLKNNLDIVYGGRFKMTYKTALKGFQLIRSVLPNTREKLNSDPSWIVYRDIELKRHHSISEKNFNYMNEIAWKYVNTNSKSLKIIDYLLQKQKINSPDMEIPEQIKYLLQKYG